MQPPAWCELSAEARRHDGDELLRLAFACCGDMVHATALRLCGDRTEAEDVAQSAFETLARRIDTLRDPAAIPGFLRGCAVRHALALLRKRRRRQGKLVELRELAEPVDDHARSFDAALVQELLVRLAPRQRHAILLRFAAEHTHDEIAALLGSSVATVRRHVDGARRELQKWA